LVDGEVAGAVDDFGISLDGNQVALGIGNPDTTITTTSAVNDGSWHHIAATRDGVSGQMSLYVDGAFQASGFGPPGTRTAPPALHIGGIQAGYGGGFFNGAIDDVQLFGRVFSPAEIPSLMNHPPAITSNPENYSVLAGRTLNITNTATDPDAPAQHLTWSLLAAPNGVAISSAGILSWRPAVAQSPATNALTLRVADNGTPVMTATQNCNVVVLAPAAPIFGQPVLGAGSLGFDIFGDAGPDYALWNSTNLQDWSLLLITNPPALPFHLAVAASNGPSQSYYRLQLQ
jgi:hypothetical protein